MAGHYRMDIGALMVTRDEWYDAFFAGDTRRLASVEAAAFIVESPQGRQSKRSQIEAIRAASVQGRWFPQGGQRTDLTMTVREENAGCIVSGTGYISDGNVAGPLSRFEEHWVWTGQAWQVSRLRHAPQERDE